jgi:hypothetical protein
MGCEEVKELEGEGEGEGRSTMLAELGLLAVGNDSLLDRVREGRRD